MAVERGVLVDVFTADGRFVGQELRERGSLKGDLVAGMQALSLELGLGDPHRLRQAIGAHRVEATFEGQGRYRIPAAEAERLRAAGLGPQVPENAREAAPATLSPRSASV